eukprot:TRINITY_DN971_c0_g1_i1.p1 TRINITY_DN971_c0_g1~~TRINITY_DN971_c0_g1_i1.p1  ORF type:complete len:554 (+),score=155.81 TRINITY_DN971_c0_g1_i1:98-1759(+)
MDPNGQPRKRRRLKRRAVTAAESSGAAPAAAPRTAGLAHAALRQEVIDTAVKMGVMGLNQGTSGNVSARVPGGFIITASGVPYESMRPEQVVFLDEQARYEGQWLPSSEWRMHHDLYKAVPEAQAIVHAHPTYCTALSCLRRDMPAFHYMIAAAGGKEIRCSDYQTFGSQGLSDAALAALGPRRSCLLANHGMISYGANLSKALGLANETECLARQYICALSTGGVPHLLSDEEMRKMLAKFKTYGKQAAELGHLSSFEREHALVPPPRRPAPPPAELPHRALRQEVIDTAVKMGTMGLNQGTSGNVSARVPGGFIITASGVPYETMRPEQVVFLDEQARYEGQWLPSSEWRMHHDIYRAVPEAQAIVHAHPTYCTALSCLRRGMPDFHYMIAVAGGDEIRCSEYETFGSQGLSDAALEALGPRRSCLLANHGMICHGANLSKALGLANETECLARQYICALSACQKPAHLGGEEMRGMLSKFKSYGKQSAELAQLSEFDRRHALIPPPRIPHGGGSCCAPAAPAQTGSTEGAGAAGPPRRRKRRRAQHSKLP